MRIKALFTVFALLGGLQASADYTEYYSVEWDGEMLENGAEITVSECSFFEDLCMYTPHFVVRNANEDEFLLYGGMYYTDSPTLSMIEADGDYWGRPQFCLSVCFANGDEERVGYGTEYVVEKTFCMPEVLMCSKEAVSTYRVRLAACIEGVNGGYSEIDDSVFEMTVIFSQDNSLVESIVDENIDTEFYNLSGLRIEKPSKGIYIEKKGSKIYKKIGK